MTYRETRIAGSDRLNTCRHQGRPVPSTRIMYATVNDALISAKSMSASTKRRRWTSRERMNDVRLLVRDAFDVCEVTAELEQEREGDEHADERDARVVQDFVGEAREPKRRRDDAEEDDRALVGEALVHKAMGRVVASAARDGASFEETHDRDQRRIEDRHGEHDDRQEERRHGRAGDRPARREPERCETEAEHLAPAVAHEYRGRASAGEGCTAESRCRRSRCRATGWPPGGSDAP